MAEKHLTVAGWRPIAKKHDIKDTDLTKALEKYEKLDEKAFDKRTAALEAIKEEAIALKIDNKKNKDLVGYLDDVAGAATTAAKEVKKAAKEAEDEDEDEDEDDDSGDLAAALSRVRSGASLAFAASLAKKPYAVALGRKIGSKHREQLIKINGSRQFLQGQCIFEAEKHTFVVERVAGGLAAKLKAALNEQTGKSYKVRVRGSLDGRTLDDETDRDGIDLTDWVAARAAAVNLLRALAKRVAAARHPESAKSLIELNAVIRQLTPEPGTSQQVKELERYLTQDDVVADICDYAFDLRKDLLPALTSLKEQLPA
jgi:hypothetical protein